MAKHDRITALLANGTIITIVATRDGGTVEVGTDRDATVLRELSRVGKVIRGVRVRDTELAATVQDNAKMAPVQIEVPS